MAWQIAPHITNEVIYIFRRELKNTVFDCVNFALIYKLFPLKSSYEALNLKDTL